MFKLTGEESIELQDVYDSLLFASITPAFIWSARSGRLILANSMGYEMLNLSSTSVEPVYLSQYVRNWKELPGTAHHSMWFEFDLKDAKSKFVQVRNSYLSAEKDTLVSVVANPRWNLESAGDQSLEAISVIIRSAATTFCSRTDFLEGFDSFVDTVAVELNLADFAFIPAETFQQYDLYQKLDAIIQRKPFYPFIEENFAQLSVYPPRKLTKMNENLAETPENWRIYPVADASRLLGYFLLEFRDQTRYRPEYYQMLLDVLSVYFQGLLENMEITKSLYQSEFENSLNSEIINNISEGVIITNSDYQIVYLNQISSMMFGFTPADVIGHPLDDLFVTSEGVRKLVMNLDTPDMNPEESPSIQYLHRRSGESFPCHIRLATLNFDEKNSYTIFVLTDVTDTEESRLKTEQLAQRAFLGDFASLLAHEIRNPINNMNIWIQNIKGLCEEGDEICQAANRIEEDCSRVSHLVNNILAFSRPLKLNLESVDLAQYLSDTLDRWKLNFARANIKHYYTPPEGFPRTILDPRAMEQVFNNLIGNAVDAFDNKGGVISLKLSIYESEIGRKQALISVSDNGPGIPDEMIDHIFEPFVTSKKKGNGWGLALSKRIITSHKGSIQVKSYPGGTVFEIFLPLSSGG